MTKKKKLSNTKIMHIYKKHVSCFRMELNLPRDIRMVILGCGDFFRISNSLVIATVFDDIKDATRFSRWSNHGEYGHEYGRCFNRDVVSVLRGF
jgi:hypothetical protein